MVVLVVLRLIHVLSPVVSGPLLWIGQHLEEATVLQLQWPLALLTSSSDVSLHLICLGHLLEFLLAGSLCCFISLDLVRMVDSRHLPVLPFDGGQIRPPVYLQNLVVVLPLAYLDMRVGVKKAWGWARQPLSSMVLPDRQVESYSSDKWMHMFTVGRRNGCA